VGRNRNEGDVLYADIPEEDEKLIQERLADSLTRAEM
jgi:hypothetical protein